MASGTGLKIKEARTAAGLTQAQVAKGAKGVSAKALSKAERGVEELTPKQLEAVAKAIGVSAESLTGAVPESAPAKAEATAGKSVSLTPEEQELLALFRSADPNKQNAAVSVFKDGQQVPLFMSMLPDVLKEDQAGELFSAMKSMIMGSKVEDLVGTVKGLLSGRNGLMGAFAGAFGGLNARAPESGSTDIPAGGSGSKEISVPLLAFTYFYSASIYILLLSFYFWQWRTDIKPEK